MPLRMRILQIFVTLLLFFLLFRSRVSFPSAQLALVVVDSHLPLCYKSAMKPFEVVEYILEVALYEEETIQFLKRKGVRNRGHSP
jgi:hypothetical protein